MLLRKIFFVDEKRIYVVDHAKRSIIKLNNHFLFLVQYKVTTCFLENVTQLNVRDT